MYELREAHKHLGRNKEELLKSEKCGCCYCCNIFNPKEIEEWVDENGTTALCPHCDIDAVIGDKSGFDVTDEKFLKEMMKKWFSVPQNPKNKK